MRATTRLRATIATQAERRYVEVPFEVPEDADSLEVVVAYDGTVAGIDLGCEGPAGWRGWSGGARTEYVIARDGATPGYLPGAPEPGRWRVILGLHALRAEGVDVEVTVSVPAGRAAPHADSVPVAVRTRRGSDRELPAEPGLRWYAGDFHAHTVHSDGRLRIGELAALGVRQGLDFLAVTDHNTVSHHPHLPGEGARHGITLIPGQEVTTHRGHANAFGDIGWVDFREGADRWIDEVERRGGVLSVNHPLGGDCSWLHSVRRRPAAVELFHTEWYADLRSTAPLAWFRNWPAGATIIGGSDFHMLEQPQRPGVPTTWVQAEDDSAEAILAGLAAGRTAVTASATIIDGAPVPDLDGPALVRVAGRLIADRAHGRVLVDGLGRRRIVHGDRASFPVEAHDGPFRLEDADRRILALSA